MPASSSSLLFVVGVVAAMLARRWLSTTTTTTSRSLRVVQYNVHRFTDFEGVARSLEALRPNIVALNEVDEDPGRLADRLGLRSYFFGHARNGSYGNAVLCREGIVTTERKLDGGAVLVFEGKEHQIIRGLVAVRVGDLLVAVTHLDHVDEKHRATQAQSVLKALAHEKDDHILLLGDLNALRRSDYDDEAWTHLERRNEINGWSPPADSAAPGGALHVFHEAGFVDLADITNMTSQHMTSVSHCRLTNGQACQRIDYALASQKLAKRISNCALSVDSSATGSDHYPLVVDLTIDDDNN